MFCVGIALVMAMFYFCFGSMLGISGVFTIIGANVCRLFGADLTKWAYFKGKNPETNPFKITILNSDIYIFFGSLLGSAIQGTFAKVQENKPYDYIKACIGGFLMGVGSRMSYGCNIGSMTSGISANSLHGFIWMICAGLGSLASVLILKLIDKLLGKEDEEDKLQKKVDEGGEASSPLMQ